MNLSEASGVDTPGVKEVASDLEVDEALVGLEATAYRACAARGNYLSLDRPDIQYAAKEISIRMSNPKQSNIDALKRLGRYLKKHPRAVFFYKHQSACSKLTVHSDTNHAGCLRTRKSTQGGVVMYGTHCIKTWSSTQAIIALSSGEAEYLGVVKATSVGLGLKSMLADMNVDVKVHVLSDATAAIGIANRLGLGQVRHMAVHYLWVQERERGHYIG